MRGPFPGSVADLLKIATSMKQKTSYCKKLQVPANPWCRFNSSDPWTVSLPTSQTWWLFPLVLSTKTHLIRGPLSWLQNVSIGRANAFTLQSCSSRFLTSKSQNASKIPKSKHLFLLLIGFSLVDVLATHVVTSCYQTTSYHIAHCVAQRIPVTVFCFASAFFRFLPKTGVSCSKNVRIESTPLRHDVPIWVGCLQWHSRVFITRGVTVLRGFYYALCFALRRFSQWPN